MKDDQQHVFRRRGCQWGLITAVAIGMTTGCDRGGPGAGADVPVVAVAPADRQPAVDAPQESDDPTAVATLEAAAAELKRDADGLVTEVSFRGREVTDSALLSLAGVRRLQSVLLNDTNAADAHLAAVGKVAALRNLDLRGCQISNDGLRHLRGLTNLRALRFSGENGATTVDDQGIESLVGLVQLKALALDHLWISEKGLRQLAPLKSLEELYLAKTLVGDEALPLLSQFSKLKKLRISQTQVTSAGLAALAAVTTLEDLDLSENSQVFDDGMAHLANLKGLKRLNLWRVAITDAGVASLAGLTALEWLNLDNTQLGDAGLPALQEMKRLTFLHLGSTAVSDAGLPNLESLTALKDLKVTRTAVTDAGVAKLREKLPQTQIQLKYIEGE